MGIAETVQDCEDLCDGSRLANHLNTAKAIAKTWPLNPAF